MIPPCNSNLYNYNNYNFILRHRHTHCRNTDLCLTKLLLPPHLELPPLIMERRAVTSP